MKVLYPNLRAEMARKGMTQTDLGRILNISTVAVHMRLSGQIQWRIEEIGKVLDFFGKDFDYLFKDE